MILLLPFGFVLLEVLSVASQVIPSSWNSTFTTSNAERVNIARAALDVAIAQLGTDGLLDADEFGVTGILYSQMAEFDIATNHTNNYKTLKQYFGIVESARQNFTDSAEQLRRHPGDCEIAKHHPGRSYGYAAVKAYTAYKDPQFLQYAVQSWWVGRSRTISQSDLSAGKIAGKNFTLRKVCRDATEISWFLKSEEHSGSEFEEQSSTPPEIPLSKALLLATARHVPDLSPRLSALLAEATSDSAYLQAANDSANFLLSHLFDPRNIIQSFISANDTSDPTCGVVSNEDPNESGVMIEGLSILSSISKSDSTQNLIWQGDNGIVSHNDGDSAFSIDIISVH
ncbi:hypothetical protein DFH09DRAFT_1105426 [Mycena vulgaris]|nr:hypothetical protein DFH09DRAFT_1105426 [Mycena vulgaris]